MVGPTPEGGGALLLWRAEKDGESPLPPALDAEGRRWLRPYLAPPTQPPSVLMTWWAALLGLSSLARYHPVEWVRAIDPDESDEAVVLERALDAAIEVLPELILEALTRDGRT